MLQIKYYKSKDIFFAGVALNTLEIDPPCFKSNGKNLVPSCNHEELMCGRATPTQSRAGCVLLYMIIQTNARKSIYTMSTVTKAYKLFP